MAKNHAFKSIGVVGCGNMGTEMSMAFSELGLDVSLWDISSQNVDEAQRMVDEVTTTKGQVTGYHNIKEFVKSLDGTERKLFMFSITHGHPADSVLEKIQDELKKGDIVLDGGNEHYRNTERRQKRLESKGVKWIGMGVSGGYQAARRGPSLSPGGERESVELALPLLEQYAAKDVKSGQPCVAYIGPSGAGHYVKMVHNGIEQGMLSTICEAWALLHHSLELPLDEVGTIFKGWNKVGSLKNTYLIQIGKRPESAAMMLTCGTSDDRAGSEVCQRKKTPQDDRHGEGAGDYGHVLDDVLDKVVQDDDSSEGTGFWTVMEAAQRHVSAPTIAAGHFFRIASGDRDQRLRVANQLQMPPPSKIKKSDLSVETIHKAAYCSILAAFCQGLELIARASQDECWDIDLAKCIKIWRGGCIIQSEHIADMLEPILASPPSEKKIMNIKLIEEVSKELSANFPALKEVVLKAAETDQYIPSLSASLEYLKYCGGRILPTSFMEAQMDFFGAHSYDRPGVLGEDPGKTMKGAHHYEWRPA